MKLDNIQVKISTDYLVVQGKKLQIPNHTFVKEILPRGANGLVFEAIDQRLERKVAVKVWIPSKEDHRDRKEQALAEAMKLAKLNHENIVTIYTCDQFENGWIYVTMEFLQGITLRELLKDPKQDYWQRFRIWTSINKALEYAHSKEVYHGDLHPGNIILVGEQVTIIDFGTSLFSLKRNPRSRATRMFIELSKLMFSDFEPELTSITDSDIYRLKPELALRVVHVWISVIKLWFDLLRILKSGRNDALSREFQSLAFEIASAPMFSIPSLVKELAKNRLSVNMTLINNAKVNSLNFFVGCCIYYAQMRLFYLNESKYEEPNGIPLDRGYNEKVIDIIWSECKSAFLKSGPFD